MIACFLPVQSCTGCATFGECGQMAARLSDGQPDKTPSRCSVAYNKNDLFEKCWSVPPSPLATPAEERQSSSLAALGECDEPSKA